jgi:hypothetical protein
MDGRKDGRKIRKKGRKKGRQEGWVIGRKERIMGRKDCMKKAGKTRRS